MGPTRAALELSCHLSPGDRRKGKTPQGDRQLRLDQVTVPDSGDYFREVQVRGSITAQKTAQVYVNWSESRIRGARHAADIEAISSLLTLKSTDCETGKENWQAIQRRAKKSSSPGREHEGPAGKRSIPLAPLGAGEVQESVKFSSREKLARCKVVEGAVKLSPGRGQRAASLEVVG